MSLRKFDLAQYEIAHHTSTAIEILACVHNTIMLIYHIHRTIRFKRKTKDKLSRIECISLFILVLLALSRYFSVMSSFSLHTHPYLSCKYYMDILATIFFLWKLSIYYLFSERLFAVFANTSFSFRKCSIKIARISLALYGASLTFLTWRWSEGYYLQETDTCLAKFPVWGSIIVAGGDLFIGTLVSVLFTRNLLYLGLSSPSSNPEFTYTATTNTKPSIPSSFRKQIENHQKESNQKQIKIETDGVINTQPRPKRSLSNCSDTSPPNDRENSVTVNSMARHIVSMSKRPSNLSVSYAVTSPGGTTLNSARSRHKRVSSRMLATVKDHTIAWKALNKFTLLTIFTIITTQAALALAAIFGIAAIWISIDTMINSWCIILMFTVHENLYSCFCLKLEKWTISLKCLSCYSCHYCCKIEPKEMKTMELSKTMGSRTKQSRSPSLSLKIKTIAKKSAVNRTSDHCKQISVNSVASQSCTTKTSSNSTPRSQLSYNNPNHIILDHHHRPSHGSTLTVTALSGIAEHVPEASPSPPPPLCLDEIERMEDINMDLEDLDMQNIDTPVPRETTIREEVILSPRDLQVVHNMRKSAIFGNMTLDVTLTPAIDALDHNIILPQISAPPSRESSHERHTIRKESGTIGSNKERERECSISIIEESNELTVGQLDLQLASSDNGADSDICQDHCYDSE